jgi:hypothetical protein
VIFNHKGGYYEKYGVDHNFDYFDLAFFLQQFNYSKTTNPPQSESNLNNNQNSSSKKEPNVKLFAYQTISTDMEMA